jgi:hypothetical protein
MAVPTDGGGPDLQRILNSRFVTPSDLIDTFNPERLSAHGAGGPGIGPDPASTGPFYVFVTTPDLNLDDKDAGLKLGIGTPTAPLAIARKLTGASGFIKLLTNMAESYSVQDIVMDVHQIADGWDGSRLTVPKHTLNSRQDGTVQIEYAEWSGTPVTTLHKVWVDYIEAVTKGFIYPKQDSVKRYITGTILDYASSIYCFQLRADGRTIEFGMRYTGCFPTAIPYSPWSGRVGNPEGIKVTVPYAYSYLEVMDMAIFGDFNRAAGGAGVVISVETPPGAVRSTLCLNFSEGKRLTPDGV